MMLISQLHTRGYQKKNVADLMNIMHLYVLYLPFINDITTL